MTGCIRWSDRRELFLFPVFEAEINGHAMTVWQSDVGSWGLQVKIGSREVEVGRASTGHKAKAAAAEWARAHEVGKVKLERRMLLGSMTWCLAREQA